MPRPSRSAGQNPPMPSSHPSNASATAHSTHTQNVHRNSGIGTLAELGIQPELIRFLIQVYGVTIFDFFENKFRLFPESAASDEDILFCFDAAFLTIHMNPKSV
jgi:hypothetical protein